jgi:hypothetical protein
MIMIFRYHVDVNFDENLECQLFTTRVVIKKFCFHKFLKDFNCVLSPKFGPRMQKRGTHFMNDPSGFHQRAPLPDF